MIARLLRAIRRAEYVLLHRVLRPARFNKLQDFIKDAKRRLSEHEKM